MPKAKVDLSTAHAESFPDGLCHIQRVNEQNKNNLEDWYIAYLQRNFPCCLQFNAVRVHKNTFGKDSSIDHLRHGLLL